MAQRVNMVEMSRKLADYLKQYEPLKSYCLEQFEKEQTVVVEYSTAEEIPGLEDTPWIMLYNASKEEGMQNMAHYECDIGIGVRNNLGDRYLETDNGALVLAAYKHVSDIINIIQEALNDRANRKMPPTVFKALPTGEIDQGGLLWSGIIRCEWDIEQVLGYEYGFDF